LRDSGQNLQAYNVRKVIQKGYDHSVSENEQKSSNNCQQGFG